MVNSSPATFTLALNKKLQIQLAFARENARRQGASLDLNGIVGDLLSKVLVAQLRKGPASQTAKARNRLSASAHAVDSRLKQWIIQARNAATLAGIGWEISDAEMLAHLELVDIGSLVSGKWVLARWEAGAHQPGNSVLIPAPQLTDLNRAANRVIQRALLSTLCAQRLAFPIGAMPPVLTGKPKRIALDAKPHISKLIKSYEQKAKIGEPKPQQFTALDFHFMAQQAKNLGFRWELTGADFKTLLESRPSEADIGNTWIGLFPKIANIPISKSNVQWGFLTALDGVEVADYQYVLTAFSVNPLLNPVREDPFWELAGHLAPTIEEPSASLVNRVKPDYDRYLWATPDLIVDWFGCKLSEWDFIPVEIRQAYVYFKHWAQDIRIQPDGTMRKAPGITMTLPYFSQFIAEVGGLGRIGSGSGKLLPIRINLERPYGPGNVVLATRKQALALHGDLCRNKTPDRHKRCIQKLQKRRFDGYYCDVDGNFYSSN